MGLFTPAWKSKNSDRALRAVEKITGQEKLARVVKEAESWEAREAAVGKLTDQNVLADIAKNDGDKNVRLAAVRNKHFSDRNALEEIAEIHFSLIDTCTEWDDNTKQTVEILIGIAKKFPGFLKKTWMKYRKKTFHEDTPHIDEHSDYCDNSDYFRPDLSCFEHLDSPLQYHRDIPAVSRYIFFPPYPLDD